MGAIVNEESFKAELRKLHDSLGFTLGWDFAMTPMAKLADAETILVGLNPGGDSYAESWECREGNDYFNGDWGEKGLKIQTQVRILHELLGIDRDDIFAAQFFPFRSAQWNDIKGRQYNDGMKFSRELWTWIIAKSKARRFVCMGTTVTAPEIAKLINAKLELPRRDSGWGDYKIDRYVSDDGRVVVGWPHPGRYTIFTRNDPARAELAKASMIAAARLS